MIGNAVPVKLAEYVAGALFRYIGSTTDSQVAVEDFKNWLIGEKNYSEKSAKDIISRCKRAERIVGHIGIPDAYYIFTLEHQLEFQGLSAPVKSQIKRALALNEQFARMQNVLIWINQRNPDVFCNSPNDWDSDWIADLMVCLLNANGPGKVIAAWETLEP